MKGHSNKSDSGKRPADPGVGGGGGVGGTILQEANRNVPLDGVAFSIDCLEWGRKFSDFWGE